MDHHEGIATSELFRFSSFSICHERNEYVISRAKSEIILQHPWPRIFFGFNIYKVNLAARNGHVFVNVFNFYIEGTPYFVEVFGSCIKKWAGFTNIDSQRMGINRQAERDSLLVQKSLFSCPENGRIIIVHFSVVIDPRRMNVDNSRLNCVGGDPARLIERSQRLADEKARATFCQIVIYWAGPAFVIALHSQQSVNGIGLFIIVDDRMVIPT